MPVGSTKATSLFFFFCSLLYLQLLEGYLVQSRCSVKYLLNIWMNIEWIHGVRRVKQGLWDRLETKEEQVVSWCKFGERSQRTVRWTRRKSPSGRQCWARLQERVESARGDNLEMLFYRSCGRSRGFITTVKMKSFGHQDKLLHTFFPPCYCIVRIKYWQMMYVQAMDAFPSVANSHL